MKSIKEKEVKIINIQGVTLKKVDSNIYEADKIGGMDINIVIEELPSKKLVLDIFDATTKNHLYSDHYNSLELAVQDALSYNKKTHKPPKEKSSNKRSFDDANHTPFKLKMMHKRILKQKFF